MRGVTKASAKLLELGVGARRAELVGHVDSRKRTDAINALGKTYRLVIRGFQVGIPQGGFAHPVGVLLG